MVHGHLILDMFTPFAHISLARRGVRPAWSLSQYYQLLKNNHFSPGSKQLDCEGGEIKWLVLLRKTEKGMS
jgi:hypothetical protein